MDRAVISRESPQAGNRLRVLDRQSDMLGSATTVTQFVGWSAPAFALRSVSGLMLAGGDLPKWEQLLDDYLKLLEEVGDALVPPSSDPSSKESGRRGAPGHALATSMQVRRLIHHRIAALPPSILDRYRSRVDAQAKKLLAEGKDQRLSSPLRRLVDEFFCSAVTDQALDFLGDLAFEEGNFEDALAWWRQLALPPREAQSSPAPTLLFPGAKIDQARVQAKEILAYGALGELDRARRELEAFRVAHSLAKGALAGSDAAYVATLEDWIKRLTEHAEASNWGTWTTFAGNPARNRALAACPSARLWADGPTWRVRLPDLHQQGGPRASPAARMAFHPLVVASQVLVADARSITSCDLFTGRQVFHFVLKDAGPERRQAGGRYTLTAWNKRVFARLGGQALGPKTAGEPGEPPSSIVCLDLAGPKPGSLLWEMRATKPDGGSGFFEGSPVAADGRVFSAVSWIAGRSTHTALACYDARTGERRWWQDICETPEFENYPEPRRRQHLITLGGGRLYYCSHSGAIAALDPWSGQILWAARYPSRGPRTEEGFPSPRDLAPCVYAGGRLYVAPLDAGRLFCLDATSGRLVWESSGMDIVHLLGVTRGRVYFTTPRGLQCSDADTGSLQGGWMQPAEGKLPGLGRGLLAGAWLLWPTQDPKLPLRGVTLADGNQERFVEPHRPSFSGAPEPDYLEPTMMRAILPGNMAFGQDCLVVAGLEDLAGYVPQKYFLKQRANDLKDAKAAASARLPVALYRLAMSQADAGLISEAEENLRRLHELTRAQGLKDEWAGLSACRTLELRGLSAPSKIKLADRRDVHAVAEAESSRPSSLDLPLQRSLSLPTDLICSPAASSAIQQGLVLGQRGQTVFCLDVLAGKVRWMRPAAPDDETAWLGTAGNVALRAGDKQLVGLSLVHGDTELRWAQSVPLQVTLAYSLEDNEPKRLTNPFPPAHFLCNERLLFFLVDRRLLMALEPATGKYAWSFWAPGGKIRPLEDGGWFNPHYAVGDRFVLLQTTAGKWLVLDSQTGKLLHEGVAPTTWSQPPRPFDGGRFVFSGQAGQVTMLDAAMGVAVWTYEPGGRTSLTGAPTQIFGDKHHLLALINRNIGPELVRLDPKKGTRIWSIPFLAGDFDARMAAFDNGAVFFACRNTLECRSLQNGALLWKKSLPGAFPAWQFIRAGEVLLAHPQEEIQVPWLLSVVNPFTLPALYHRFARFDSERAILIIDPRDGQLLQRLPLPEAVGGPISVEAGENLLAVKAGGKLIIFRSSSSRPKKL
jgi:outer membrane protein assembly factor BamB